MKNKRNWIIGIALTATAAFVAVQNAGAPAPTETLATDPAYEGCAYTWAYHDDPALTEKLNTQIQALDENANASATLFGEDCLYADGHSTFGVMETDFYIRLQVEDLSDEEPLGNWIHESMEVVTQLPREEIQGGRYGFVEYYFETESEKITLRVPIQKYLDEAQSKSGVDLFQMFDTSP